MNITLNQRSQGYKLGEFMFNLHYIDEKVKDQGEEGNRRLQVFFLPNQYRFKSSLQGTRFLSQYKIVILWKTKLNFTSQLGKLILTRISADLNANILKDSCSHLLLCDILVSLVGAVLGQFMCWHIFGIFQAKIKTSFCLFSKPTKSFPSQHWKLLSLTNRYIALLNLLSVRIG